MERLSDVEIYSELLGLTYTQKGFDEVITLVWALPDSFWVRVCKRLIATVIVCIQCPYVNLPSE